MRDTPLRIEGPAADPDINVLFRKAVYLNTVASFWYRALNTAARTRDESKTHLVQCPPPHCFGQALRTSVSSDLTAFQAPPGSEGIREAFPPRPTAPWAETRGGAG